MHKALSLALAAVASSALVGLTYAQTNDAFTASLKRAMVEAHCPEVRKGTAVRAITDRYGEISGTLPMSLIKTEASEDGRAPHIIVSFSYDETVTVACVSGISYASSVNRRGDHGSFSPTDTRISLLASGPDFKSGFIGSLPTANVDIAPTVARILGLTMPAAQGRVIEEALAAGPQITDYTVRTKTHRSSIRTGLTVELPTDLDGRSVDPNRSKYWVELETEVLSRGGATYTYFDHARATRE